MTNAPLLTAEELHDVESRNHFRHVVDAGADAETALASMRPMAPRQRPHAAAVGIPAATPASPAEPRGPQSTRTTWRVNAEAARTDPESVFHHYRRLIELRHKEPSVVDGNSRSSPDDERVYAFTRRLASTELLVLGNFTGDHVEVPLPSVPRWASSEILLSNAPEPTWTLGGVHVQPWQAVVYRRRS